MNDSIDGPYRDLNNELLLDKYGKQWGYLFNYTT